MFSLFSLEVSSSPLSTIEDCSLFPFTSSLEVLEDSSLEVAD
jgi:hypothetical protein